MLDKQASLKQCNDQMVETINNERKTVEMTGPAGRIVVPMSQLSYYQQQGYVELVGNSVAETVNASVKSENEPGNGEGESDNGGNGSGDGNTEVVDFTSYTDEQLQEFADIAGLPGTIKKRETIITKLIELGFKPETATGEGE